MVDGFADFMLLVIATVAVLMSLSLHEIACHLKREKLCRDASHDFQGAGFCAHCGLGLPRTAPPEEPKP